jgi:TetR/AcrR family transcriptional regulator, tetracycline repressor protein
VHSRRSGNHNGNSVTDIIERVKAAYARRVKNVRENAQANPPRRSPGRPPVPLDRIVGAALELVEQGGAGALSMRSLAQRLDSGTATLYRRFASRAALIAHVVDHVFGEVPLEPEALTGMSWQEACRTLARGMFDALSRHRGLAPLLLEQVPIGPNVMAQRERWLAVLLEGGFPPELAARTFATLVRHVLGFAIQLDPHRGAHQDDPQLAAAFHGTDPSRFPATQAVADSLPVPLEVEFAFGLELLVEGLGALRERSARRRRRARGGS